jgi:hypothetical protein
MIKSTLEEIFRGEMNNLCSSVWEFIHTEPSSTFLETPVSSEELED